MKFKYKNQPPEVLCKKNVIRNFTKFKGKHLCQSLFFNEVAGLRLRPLATLLKKRLWHKCFPVNFVKFLRAPFSQYNAGRLFLKHKKRNFNTGKVNQNIGKICYSNIY